MAEWTREELVAAYPEGTVGTQVDDTFTPFTSEEWAAWIEDHIGLEKPSEQGA